MAMDGEDSARFYGIEDALALVFRCCPEIKGLAQSWICFRLLRKIIHELLIYYHLSCSIGVIVLLNSLLKLLK